jgi:hypothetical protein
MFSLNKGKHTMTTNNIQALYNLMQWQGGTVHQLADVVDVPAETLLYGMPSNALGVNSSYIQGQSAFDTCRPEYVKAVLLKAYRGNADFWLGYMRAAALKEVSK